MKLENQVCTEEQGERLKALGAVQESLFYHTHRKKWGVMPRKSIDFNGNPTSAFTVAELGVMLPEEQAYKFFSTFYNDHSGNWEVEYRGFKTDDELEDWNSIEPPPKIYETEGDTEAQARAEMIIWLLENKIVSPGEINQRLQNS